MFVFNCPSEHRLSHRAFLKNIQRELLCSVCVLKIVSLLCPDCTLLTCVVNHCADLTASFFISLKLRTIFVSFHSDFISLTALLRHKMAMPFSVCWIQNNLLTMKLYFPHCIPCEALDLVIFSFSQF